MRQIILNFGNGNTCKNDRNIVTEMYNSLEIIDNNKYEIIVSWELFEYPTMKGVPLKRSCFDYAYKYGRAIGYKTTAAAYDKNSLDFILGYSTPFIRIDNDGKALFLIKNIPEDIMVYISSDLPLCIDRKKNTYKHLWCVNKYPATILDYEKIKLKKNSHLLDNTQDFKLFFLNNPDIIEWNFKMYHSAHGVVFARTPADLIKIL